MRVRLTSWAVVAATMLALGPVHAEAQAWLTDRSHAEGIGIRTGRLEIHPGIAAELGYDSNVFLRDVEPVGSAVLRVSPHLFVSTLGPQRNDTDAAAAQDPAVDFRFGGSLPIYYYFNTPRKGRIEANADVMLQLLPNRPVSFVLNGKYNRTERPFTEIVTLDPVDMERVVRDRNYGRNTLNVGPRINFQTTGGVLKAGIGGNFQYDFFDEGETGFGAYDTKTYGALVNASWEFLPKTALVYEAELAYRDYDNNDAGAPSGALRNDGTRYQFRMGLNGALTARVSATAMVGYTALFFENNDDTDNVSIAAELRWKPSPTLTTKLGFDRSVTSAFQGNFSLNNKIYAGVDLLAGGALLLTAGANLTFVSYGHDDAINMMESRADTRLGLDLGGEYRFTDWLALTANAALLKNFSDFEQALPGGGTDPVEFVRFEIFGGLRLFY